ncbi:MAG TPA: hypothetical protein VFV89_07845 [Nocardioides sp.]|uniref:hypothetical protein n=1 Tax=Nocardioides sp. TaxID=35761 RepID=UPI002E3242E3|nr:hypothetical protein [Nocardioides sp.]HEX5087704.1 hypothetical protein [Nocardioides sp.]
MRSDADLAVYVAARWPSLVREAVLLGVGPDEAADVAVDALARCRKRWRQVSHEHDPDAVVREELAWAASRRPTTPTESRERAAEDLLVLAPPTIRDLEQRARDSSRATLEKAAKVAVPLVLVAAGAGAYFATTGDGTKEPPSAPRETISQAATTHAENPAPGVVWYADGQLHLADRVVAVEGLTNMTRIGTGVVYGDEEGRVVHLRADGTRDLLGHTDPAAPVAASDESSWAAWVDTGTGALVVEQADTGEVVGTTEVAAAARVVAVDGTQVYFVDADGLQVYTPGTDPQLRPFLPGDMLDARARMTAFQGDQATIQVSPAFFSVVHALPGQGAQLSPDGRLVATRLPDGRVAIYDTASGHRLDSGLARTDDVVAFAPGRYLTMDYVVVSSAGVPTHDLELRTCRLRPTTCTTATRIPNTGGMPVLAR